ncbi:MAG: response regulator [Desulfobacterales bacterium]|nr:MAG: response regulator [Desulfobacterales bacterium]
MKVLLVDDEKKFATMLAKRLALRGIDVDYVHTGEDAIAKSETDRYDVAILDVKMPGIGGIELERRLKGLAPGMKIIFLTGHGSKHDFETGSAEAARYLVKPVQIDELIKILQEVAG